MKCNVCGSEIADDSVFCEFCGAKMPRKRSSFFSARIKPFRLLGIIGSLAVMILLLFCFVIDNPKVHYCTTFRGIIDYYYSDYVRLLMKGTDYADKNPYHFRNKWTYIRFEWEDAQDYYKTRSKTIVDGCFFAPRGLKGEHVITDWWFWIPKDKCIEFKPGTTYKVSIYGQHDGIIFDCWIRNIDFVFTFPSNPEVFDRQIPCEVK